MDALPPRQFLEKYFGKRPDEVDIEDSLLELKGSAEEISEEKKNSRQKELEDMDSSHLSREFGLDS